MELSDLHTFDIFSIHPVEFDRIEYRPRLVDIADLKE